MVVGEDLLQEALTSHLFDSLFAKVRGFPNNVLFEKAYFEVEDRSLAGVILRLTDLRLRYS